MQQKLYDMINIGELTDMKLKVRNPFIAFLLALLLLAIFGGILLYKTGSDTEKRMKADNQSKMGRIKDAINVIESQRDEEVQNYFSRLDYAANLMAFLLEDYISDDQYTGPDSFENGYVVHVKDGKVNYITQSEFTSDFNPDWINPENRERYTSFFDKQGNWHSVYVSSAQICDGFYYIKLNTINDLYQWIYDLDNPKLVYENLEKSFNSRIISVAVPEVSTDETNSDELVISYISNEFDGITKPEELGITPEVLSKKPETLTLNGTSYHCDYKEYQQFDMNQTVIILSDIQKTLAPDAIITILFIVLSAFFMIAFILSLYWYQTYVRDHDLAQSQVKTYHPRKLRKLAFSSVFIGTFGLFVFILFYQYVANVRNETVTNRFAIENVMNYLYDNYEKGSVYQKNEIKWYTNCGKDIATVFSVSDDAFARTKLIELNEKINSQYIMLFDTDGNEIASSNGLIGYSLKETAGLNLFQSLLSGYNEITPTSMADPFSDQKLQFIGVNVPHGDSFGALIIAIDPEKVWVEKETKQFNDFLHAITSPEKLCLILNKTDDTVHYSSDPDLVGKKIPTINFSDDMPEESDLDTYDINKKRYYGPFRSDEIYAGFYLTAEEYLHNNTFSVAVISAFGFFVTAALIGLFMLSPHTSERYVTCLNTKTAAQDNRIDIDSLEDFLDRTSVLSLKKQFNRWIDLIPEEKSSLLIHLILVLVFLFLIRLNSGINSMVGVTVFDFILYGKWHRGFNMLGLAGAALVIMCLFSFMLVRSFILKILGGLLDPKINTIISLFLSLLQYAAVICSIYLIMGFFGFNPAVQLTSIGILSLAISLGSKDLVADILAGLFIIFEDDFHVGDFIEIDGFRGIVQNIGIRTTRIVGLGDYIKIIDNQNIKKVLNLSKMNTWYTLELKVPLDTPIRDIEAMMEKDLPQVAIAIPEIISGPFYKGIWSIGGGMTLTISCECDEENLRALQRKLNREILLMFNKNGIKLL